MSNACDIVWRHTVTGASLGVCGKPTERTFTSHCPSCGYTADCAACDPCWASHKDYGLCGKCFTRLEIS